MYINAKSAVYSDIEKPFKDAIPPIQTPQVDMKKLDDKKLEYALLGLGIATVATIGIGSCILAHKPIKLNKITFEKGVASLKKNGEKFSGKVKDTLKNGDKIVLEYKDGIIQSSNRIGSKNISKKFEYLGGNKIVHSTKGGKISTINVSEKIAKVKAEIAEKEARKIAQIKAEANRRIENSAKAELLATQAQQRYNAPFENALANKSARQSAEVFEESIRAEVRNRQISENLAKQKAEAAQELFNKPFDDMLSHKSASESAEVFRNDVVKRKKSILTDYYYDDGSVRRTVQDKTSKVVEQIDEKGNILSRKVNQNVTSPNGLQTRISNTTKFSENGKFSNGSASTSIYDEIETTKHYVKDSKGKYTSIKRTKETVKNGEISQYKEVMHLENGNSKTVVDDMYERTTKTTVRDKKGNILSESINKWDDSAKGAGSIPPPEEMKQLADWYIHYLKLCEKYGVPVRPCGVQGGAGSHYFELCMLDADPKKYYKYMELQRYRARYDANARLSCFLSNNQTYNSEEVEKLLEMLKNGTLSIDDIMMIIDDYGESIPNSIKQILKSLNNNQISREVAIENIKKNSTLDFYLDDVWEEVTDCYQSYQHQQPVYVYA